MPITLALLLLVVALASGAAGHALGRSATATSTGDLRTDDLRAALAEREAFIEHLREVAWQHRDVSPELATVLVDEIATHHRRLPGNPDA